MANVTWIGEDTADVAGPSFTTCYGGIRFPKDVAVEIDDPEILRKARGNPYFKVLVEENGHGENAKTQEDQGEDKAKNQGTGYSPVKKKVRKKKPEPRADDPIG